MLAAKVVAMWLLECPGWLCFGPRLQDILVSRYCTGFLKSLIMRICNSNNHACLIVMYSLLNIVFHSEIHHITEAKYVANAILSCLENSGLTFKQIHYS